jgi:H+/gluconate symporter-like permease
MSEPAGLRCPRCQADVQPGQEYCLECGVRLPGPGPVGSVNDAGAGWVRRAVIGLAVALAGAAAAVACTASRTARRLVDRHP